MILKFSKRLIIFIFLLPNAACVDMLVDEQIDNNWKSQQRGSIIVFYNPLWDSPYSSKKEIIDTILINQNYYYNCIQDSIHRKFRNTVAVYLYSNEDGKTKIGTSDGGYANPDRFTYYYSVSFTKSDLLVLGRKDYVGAHELAHVITFNCLGVPGSRLFSEGYANWLDNTYAEKYLFDWMKFWGFSRILTLQQLIEGTSEEKIYYPNSGTFIKFLVSKYGIEKANSLFTINNKDLTEAFKKTLGKDADQLQAEYNNYCVLNFNQ